MMMLLNEEPGHEKIQNLLHDAESSRRDVFMNAVNVGETYYIVYRRHGEDVANQFLTLLESTQITIIIPNFDDILLAAQIKAKHAISYADAFAVATAMKENLPVVTGDPEFQQVENMITVEWV